jgi:hypothetical protein
VSKRFDQDISAIAVAFSVQVEEGRVVAARIAFGGMAAVAARAPATERALVGAEWSEGSIDFAVAKLAEDFKPLTDMRASSAYRLQTAGNLLRRFYFEHSGRTGPIRTAGTVAPPFDPTRTADAVAASAGTSRVTDPTAAPSGPTRATGPGATSSSATPIAGPTAASL